MTSRDDVSVAGMSWSTDACHADDCPPTAGDAYACGPILLALGANAVTIIAEDAAGNRVTAPSVVSYVSPSGTNVTPPTLVVSGIADGTAVDAEPIWVTVTSVDDHSFPTVT